nr:RNA-directed DNA polymerase, eukaryota, reverse transcriptase zinc-binding domain protein [Tanacetum cinerariifolium]
MAEDKWCFSHVQNNGQRHVANDLNDGTAGFTVCINGERHGYFKGGRGLRQRDHMSPYLFTLIMEILTLILQRKIRNNESFKYHYGCKELKLVNLFFADDLMIFCNRDPTSPRVIKDGLNEFSAVSGLFPNLNKSTLYFGSLKDDEKELIKNVMQFTEGTLPSKSFNVLNPQTTILFMVV